MNLAKLISFYVELSVFVTVCFLVCSVIFYCNQRYRFLKFSDELKFAYAVLLAPLLFLVGKHFLPRRELFEPVVRIWNSQTLAGFYSSYSPHLDKGYLALTADSSSVAAEGLAHTSGWVLVGVVVLWGFFFSRDLFRLKNILSRAYVMKSFKGFSFDWSDSILVPFSYWLPGKRGVVLPSAMVALPSEKRISLLHELQHHRQRDPQWIYLFWVYRILFFWNPLAHVWSRKLSELQEFACDESLIGRKKISPEAYARCLVQVAKHAQGQKASLACATGLTFLTHGHLLKRRVKAMFAQKQNGRSSMGWIASAAVLFLGGVALASQSLIQDRRLSLQEAQALGESVRKSTDFPIAVNDLVLKELNRFLGTHEGRENFKAALRRMDDYEPMITNYLRLYGHPSELLAVPIVESGYRNRPPSTSHGVGAGIWMFIQETAKRYRLRVDASVDERTDPFQETRAAMDYFRDLSSQFKKNWELALLGYYVGENAVEEAIKSTGSRDAWVLVREGIESDSNYLARVIAAVIILKNPSVLD